MFGGSEEGGETTAAEEEDGVEDILPVPIGHLKKKKEEWVEKKADLGTTHVQSAIKEKLTHAFGVKCEEF
jgi:hypothetical protein